MAGIPKSFRLDKGTLATLDEIAAEQGWSRTKALHRLIGRGARVYRAERRGGRVVEEMDGVRTEL